MKNIVVEFTDSEYEMLKNYAAARRKHEVGKGFTVVDTIAQIVSIGLEAISETIIVDKEGNAVDWNPEQIGDEQKDDRRIFYSRY